MMRRFRLFLAAMMAASSAAPVAADAAGEGAPAAFITLTHEDGGMRLLASVAAPGGAFEGRADLTVSRIGPAGTARTRQGQTLSLATGESARVATSHLSFGDGDALDATLVVRDAEGAVVARSTVNVGGSE